MFTQTTALHASVRYSFLCSIRHSALKLFPSKRWETNQSLRCIMQERTHLIGITLQDNQAAVH